MFERASLFRTSQNPLDSDDAGRSLFRQYEGLSLTDGVLVADMQRAGIEYIYSFDDGFDAPDGITRLDTAVNPFS